MKILTLIVHTNEQQELSDRLLSMDKVSGFTFTHVEGHGDDIEKDGFFSAREKVVGYIPRIRTDLLLEDSDVDSVLENMPDKKGAIAGQGFYWITPVEKGGHIL
jgi:nitrogen regulatory protein P-II 1